jgi:hypothetical protein
MSNKRLLRGRKIPAVASLEKSLTIVGRTTPMPRRGPAERPIVNAPPIVWYKAKQIPAARTYSLNFPFAFSAPQRIKPQATVSVVSLRTYFVRNHSIPLFPSACVKTNQQMALSVSFPTHFQSYFAVLSNTLHSTALPCYTGTSRAVLRGWQSHRTQ